jgi:hypothetical protein
MMRFAFTTAAALALASLALERSELIAQGDQHAYFNALVQRSDHWKSYSFRDPKQLEGPWVTYNPAADTDRHKQDAAKVVIPAFIAHTVLTAPVSSGNTTLLGDFKDASAYGVPRVAIRIDNEVMSVTSYLNSTSITVQRGAFGTVAAPHAGNAVVQLNINSLPHQVAVPLRTEDGHAYLFTWDGYWTDSYMNLTYSMAHKTFQFGSGGRNGHQIWFEPQTDYAPPKTTTCFDRATHVFGVDYRTYNSPNTTSPWTAGNGIEVGPGTTADQIGPKSGQFCAKPNTWVRWWIRINQKANDWDDLDAWVADETTGPVQVLRGLKLSVIPTGGLPNSIADFWLEFNTSTEAFLRPDSRDLVAYVRNFVALKDVGDVSNLLIRPVPGAAPTPGPAAPKNVRIFRQ